MAGSFLMLSEAENKYKFPKINANTQIFALYQVTSQKSHYNIIFCQGLLWELGISLDVQNNFFGWKETKIPKTSINCKMRSNFTIQESKNVKSATNRIKKILGTKYEKANLKEIATKLKYLNSDEQL